MERSGGEVEARGVVESEVVVMDNPSGAAADPGSVGVVVEEKEPEVIKEREESTEGEEVRSSDVDEHPGAMAAAQVSISK